LIYVDSSVALARLLFETRAPPARLWQEQLTSSQLLEYEVWNRIHAYGLTDSHADQTRALLLGVELIEMTRTVLATALEPLPLRIRTLDALHLATMTFVRVQGQQIELASYDNRLIAAARALAIPIAAL
jgi:predicted nucleic acid-binding protein